jgi:phosphate transport system substrate-binding protein
MVNLTLRWVEVFLKNHPDVNIQVSGGGSGTGIAALLNSTADIANISRELKDRELERANELNIKPVKVKVALDGIAVIVHKDNPLDTLTINQLRDIFSGKIKNWSDLGWKEQPIILYGRENSSGTYELFKENVLGRNKMNRLIDFSPSTQVLQGTAALAEAVAQDVKSIGYGGVGYFANRSDLKILYLKSDESSIAVSPIFNNEVNYDVIWSGEYALSRYLYCYTNGEPEGVVKEFIEFITSDQGQRIVSKMEYIPLPPSDNSGG